MTVLEKFLHMCGFQSMNVIFDCMNHETLHQKHSSPSDGSDIRIFYRKPCLSFNGMKMVIDCENWKWKRINNQKQIFGDFLGAEQFLSQKLGTHINKI